MTFTKIIETVNNRSIHTVPKQYLLLRVLKGIRECMHSPLRELPAMPVPLLEEVSPGLDVIIYIITREDVRELMLQRLKTLTWIVQFPS